MATGRTGARVTTIDEVLDVRRDAVNGSAVLGFPRELHGAFGGAFGGLLAAGLVLVGRDSAPGRIPAGIDCRFVRGLGAGDARATTTVIHAGRSLTLLRVDLHDGSDRLATTATVSYVDPAALHPLDVDPPHQPDPETWREWMAPPGIEIPIAAVLHPRLAAVGPGVVASSLRVPWDDPEGTYSAEAACVAADFCVGPPVAAACEGAWLPHPNPDVSVRFGGHGPVGDDIVGVGRVARIAGGLAVVDIEVRAQGMTVAAGAATSMVLPGR